jgi:hypothetical protein
MQPWLHPHVLSLGRLSADDWVARCLVCLHRLPPVGMSAPFQPPGPGLPARLTASSTRKPQTQHYLMRQSAARYGHSKRTMGGASNTVQYSSWLGRTQPAMRESWAHGHDLLSSFHFSSRQLPTTVNN